MLELREEILHFSGTPVLKTNQTAIIGTLPQNNSFLLKMRVDLDHAGGESMLAELPGAFSLKRRFTGPEDQFDEQAIWHPNQIAAQHYASFPMPDNSCPVIEWQLFPHDEDHPQWNCIQAGFPQSLLSPGEHELAVYTDGIRMQVLVDGHLMDENFIYGQIRWQKGEQLSFDPALVKEAEFYTPCPKPEVSVAYKTVPDGIQYYSTPGYDSWVGDVVPFEHDGTVHMFYLHDRRHHGSKWGMGAHYYGHLSSTDLIHWHEEEFIGRFESQNETCGTGTPFFHNGKFYFAYGLHTDRFVPKDTTSVPLLLDDLKKTGKVHSIAFKDLGERPPEGMTYAVSDDCRHFEKSYVVAHFSENPSVYTMPDNSLRMYADGIWRADQVNGPWSPVSSDFPLNGKSSPMRNTLECPSFFEWGGHYYLIVGMSGMYSSSTPDFESFDDMAFQGTDIYDGLIVPMVIPYHRDRRLIAGWVFPFGSYLVIRELVLKEDHKLGIKWCPELYPPVKNTQEIANGIDESVGKDVCYHVKADGSHGGKIGFRFYPAVNDAKAPACEFQLDLATKTMQIDSLPANAGNGFLPPLKTMRGQLDEWRDKVTVFKEMPTAIKYKCHVFSKDFRVENVSGTDGDFELNIRLHFDPKMPATLIDVEAAGFRTMVSLRCCLKVARTVAMTDGGAMIEKITKDEF